MNKIKILVLLFLCVSTLSTQAQYSYFGTRGSIYFDKITYIKARLKSAAQNSPNGGFGRGMFNTDNMPESTTQKLLLYFDENSTLLVTDPSAENASEGARAGNRAIAGAGMVGRRGNTVAGAPRGGTVTARGGERARLQGETRIGMSGSRPNNATKVMFQDLKKKTTNLQIEVDENYIITDTINQITWRFTDEYRNIAGFECRRANGATADSLYLVAFFTDEIPVSAGPAFTSGLPGMILGLAIPEMHIQYWATKVEYTNNTVPADWKNKKSTTITFDDFLKSFGRFYQRGRDSNSNKRQVQEQLIY